MQERMELLGRKLLEQLVSYGFEAYWVGGCVRDKLLGRQLKDIDIATSAKPEDVMRFFSHSIPTGLQHGTVTVVEEGIPFEITTFRRETEYEQHRRPKSVQYISDLNEDLQRRDFTINAIAMDATGKLIDPFEGQKDLQRRRLRCVGRAEERFQEDALRMLRCIRFACEYELEIEERTWAALQEHAPLLSHIAMERVQAELHKMISGAGPDRGIELLAESGLLRYTKDKLAWPIAGEQGEHEEKAEISHGRSTELGENDLWNGRLATLEATELRWAYWMLQMRVSADEARQGFSRLRFSSSLSSSICRMLQVQEWMAARLSEAAEASALSAPREEQPREEPLREALVRACVRFGADTVRGWLRLLALGAPAPAPAAAHAAARALPAAARQSLLQSGTDWVQALPAARVSELALAGGDLLAALRRPAGPWLGRELERLLLEVALGRLPNDKGRLIEAARQQNESEADE